MRKGNLIVISGASAVGKSSVLKKVLSARDDLQFSVSATTRAPREGEQDGVQYFFISKEKFQALVEQGAFAEYDYHMGNYYGTLFSEIEKKVALGNMVLDVEPNGAMAIRKLYPDAVLIFLTPPSIDALETRMRGRGGADETEIQTRLSRAAWEIAQSEHYDYVVVNDVLDDCVAEVLRIISNKIDCVGGC